MIYINITENNNTIEPKITIINAICGAGKTQFAIQLMNEADSNKEKFIYITPFLTEVERVRKNVTTKKFYEPSAQKGKGSKYNHFKELLLQGKNIVSTHSLFTNINTDILETITYNNYTLILDEVIEVTENITISNKDWSMLITEKLLEVEDKTNKIKWLDNEYEGKFDNIKELAQSNNLYLHTRSGTGEDKKKTLLVWTFPIEIFQAFKKVYNLTYMFDGQLQKYYFDMYNAKYEYKSVKQVDNDNKYELITYDKRLDNRELLKTLINVYEGNYNTIGEDYYSLSKTWLEKALKNNNIKALQYNTYNYFFNYMNSKSQFNMWTSLKGTEDKRDKIRLALSGKGYTRGFVSCNARATNDYINKNCCAYLVNRFLNPIDKGFFEDKGITINEDIWSLSELIQWLFRSAIRKQESINLYIPSKRMRELLYKWLKYEI
jgi:hypothetical protein